MKRATVLRIYSAMLLMVFTIGSISFSPSKTVTKNVKESVVKSSVEKQAVSFINDASLVQIPVNHIGFYSFVYPAGAAWCNYIVPVANAPPKPS